MRDSPREAAWGLAPPGAELGIGPREHQQAEAATGGALNRGRAADTCGGICGTPRSCEVLKAPWRGRSGCTSQGRKVPVTEVSRPPSTVARGQWRSLPAPGPRDTNPQHPALGIQGSSRSPGTGQQEGRGKSKGLWFLSGWCRAGGGEGAACPTGSRGSKTAQLNGSPASKLRTKYFFLLFLKVLIF